MWLNGFQNIYHLIQPLPLFNSRIFSLPPNKVSPSPKPLATTNMLSVLWISLFWTICINRIIQYVAFCVWFLLFSVVVSRSMSVIASYLISVLHFFYGWIIFNCMDIQYCILFFNSSDGGHLYCFCFWAFTCNAAINIQAQVFV